MNRHCENFRGCRFCKFMSRSFGHPLMFVMGKHWPKLETAQVLPHLDGLDLEIVGGLRERGWTIHDIDVIGNIKDVSQLIVRVRQAGIVNPVHFCDVGHRKHSHFMCIKDGLESLFLGDKMYS